MRRLIWIAEVLLFLFSATSAPCQSSFDEETVADEEYGIYRQVLQRVGGASSVDNETLGGVRADAATLMVASGVRLESDIVQSFNTKNFKKHLLSESFLKEMSQASGPSWDGRKKVTFSRVGFDGLKRRALLLVGSTFYCPEDIMNEGKYLLLEKKDNKWTVVKTITAWNMQLGKIR